MFDDDDLEIKVVASKDGATRWIQVKSRSCKPITDDAFYTELECFLHNVDLDEAQMYIDMTLH